MKVKVCGMKYWENIQEVIVLSPDYMGFIFHKESPRDISVLNLRYVVKNLPEIIKSVGVFVDSPLDFTKKMIEEYEFNLVQLHGNEPPEYCRNLLSSELNIIKAFQLDDDFDFNVLEEYKSVCDYYLFDTKGKSKGGNGQMFNWDVLDKYTGEKPFFLSGGIDENAVAKIKKMSNPNLFGVDVNSKFEIEPGLKDSAKLKSFMLEL